MWAFFSSTAINISMQESLDKITNTVKGFNDHEQFNNWLLNTGKSIPSHQTISLCNEHNYVRGCSSNVWISGSNTNNKWLFEFYSDTLVTRGVGFVLTETLNGMDSDQVNQISFNDFNIIGTYLTLTRKKGLQAMINHMKSIVNA